MTSSAASCGMRRPVLSRSEPPGGATSSAIADERFPSIRLCGIPFHRVSEAETINYIMRSLDDGMGGWVITPNLDILRRLTRDAAFRELSLGASLRVADGMPLIWASRLQGTPLPERVAGSDLISSVSAAAARHRRRVYLLGGEPGSAEAAAEVLRSRHPELVICGIDCPPFGFERDEAHLAAIEQKVREAAPDIAFVALGCPKQEHLIERLRRTSPRCWWLGVGISFSFLAGRVQRAPRWMQKSGLEWVHRLAQEPGRLARRYLIDDLPFAVQLFASSAAQRWRRP